MMKIGKKIAFGTAVALTLIFSGCGESAEDKGKIEFQNYIQTGGMSKAIVMSEEKYSKEIVNKWVKELKKEGKFKNAFEQYENRGKGGEY